MWNEPTKQFIASHRNDDVRKLALQAKSFAGHDMDIPFALTQIAGRRTAAEKIPAWTQYDDLIFPPRLALEQCSSEKTARYKASLLTGATFADLTGGFAVDFFFIAQGFKKAFYVERQKKLCEIAEHNFKVLGLNEVAVENADSVEFLKTMLPVDAIFIDPARRSISGKKIVSIENAEPNILEILDLLFEKTETVLIKLSPMLDISQALKKLKSVAEVHVVGVENECKELLFLLRKNYSDEPEIHCVNLLKKDLAYKGKYIFRYSEEKACEIEYTSEIASYLYEPDVSLLKAGFFKMPAKIFPVRKLHPDSHLYTSNEFISDFPGHIFRVESCVSMNKKDLKNLLQGIKKANLTVRNFPMSVADLRKKLKIAEGGDVSLFATTLANGKHVLIRI